MEEADSEAVDLAEADIVAADLVEEVAGAVIAEELRLGGLVLGGPYPVEIEGLIRIIDIIPDVDIIDIGTCLGIEGGGTARTGQDIIVVLFIILRLI